MDETDERLRQAIRAGNIGIFEHDHVTDVLYWSPELRRMYGWDARRARHACRRSSATFTLTTSGASSSRCKAAHDPTGEGAFDIEHRIVDRAGRLRWVLTRSQTYFDDAAGGRSALAHDRRRARRHRPKSGRGTPPHPGHGSQLERPSDGHHRRPRHRDLRECRRAPPVGLPRRSRSSAATCSILGSSSRTSRCCSSELRPVRCKRSRCRPPAWTARRFVSG